MSTTNASPAPASPATSAPATTTTTETPPVAAGTAVAGAQTSAHASGSPAETKPASLRDIVKAAAEKSQAAAKGDPPKETAAPAAAASSSSPAAAGGAPAAAGTSPEKPADPDAAHLAAIVEAERRNAADRRAIDRDRQALQAERDHAARGKAIADAVAKGDPLAALQAAGLKLDHPLVYALAKALPDGDGEPEPQAQDVDKLVDAKLTKLQQEQAAAAQATSKQQFLGHVRTQVQQAADRFPRLHAGGQEAAERVDARFLDIAKQNGGQAPHLQQVLDDVETDMAVEEIAGGREQLEALPFNCKRAFDAAMDKYPGIKAEGMTPASIVAFGRQVARASNRVPSAQEVLDAAEKYWREKYQEKNPYGTQPKPPSGGVAAAGSSAGAPGKKEPTSLREKVNAALEAKRASAQ